MYIAGIIGDSIVDGPGLRTTVFAQGCAHNCKACHNPETHAFNIGNVMSPEEIFSIVKKNPLCKGVTFSGGDPLYQSKEFAQLARLLKADGYEIACYTGFIWEELLSSKDEDQLNLLRNVDILIDGPFILAERTLSLRFRGSSNQRIIESRKSMVLYDESAGKIISPILSEQERWIGKKKK